MKQFRFTNDKEMDTIIRETEKMGFILKPKGRKNHVKIYYPNNTFAFSIPCTTGDKARVYKNTIKLRDRLMRDKQELFNI